jgi:hypothetical protein
MARITPGFQNAQLGGSNSDEMRGRHPSWRSVLDEELARKATVESGKVVLVTNA